MSLSDLELIQLVDSVKEKQKGPQGEPGVGVASIEQFDETSFTITLTNGASKKVVLPAAVDGQPGEPGPAGPQGEPGPAGRNGAKGRDGTDGTVGAQGLPGVSLDTAVVNADGHLLLGLTDGAVIDVGRVVGPAGATGATGGVGLPGNDGADGAAVLSGPRAPSQDDGKEGDHWIDISSAEFGFFKKNGQGWQKLANLRQPARDPRVGPVAAGGGSVSAGGGGAEVHVGPDAPSGPSTGELWFDTKGDELTLYIWTGAEWVPAAPPVSLDGINATIDTALIVQNDLKARVTDGERKQKTLENKVAALEGTVVDGVWKYGSRAWPQNPGEFDLTVGENNKTTAWQDATTLRIYKTDARSKNFTFSEVSVADFVRIGQLGTNAVYKILSEARPKENYFEFLVEVVSYEDQALEAILEYNFEFLPAFDATAYATKQYVDDVVADIEVPAPAWTPSAFMWEWGGNNDTREDPGPGKFQVSNDNKTRICFSATLANGIWIGNVFKSSHNYAGHKDRIVLWHEQSPGQWKAWFEGLIVKYDGASNWWHMELDPISYGRITSWSSGLYYATGGPW